jgi:hypothetical protein
LAEAAPDYRIKISLDGLGEFNGKCRLADAAESKDPDRSTAIDRRPFCESFYFTFASIKLRNIDRFTPI